MNSRSEGTLAEMEEDEGAVAPSSATTAPAIT